MRQRERGDHSADEAIPHGTTGGYTNHKCSCVDCRAAFAQAIQRGKQRRSAEGLPAGDVRHGTDNGYSRWGCRCVACKAAHAAEARAYWARRKARGGTR